MINNLALEANERVVEEVVDSFHYLGSVVTADRGAKKDVKSMYYGFTINLKLV